MSVDRLIEIENVIREIGTISYDDAERKYTIVFGDDNITFTDELFDSIESSHNIKPAEIVWQAIECIRNGETEVCE